MSLPLSASMSRWRAVLLAGLVTLLIAACSGQVELLSQVPESQANEVLAVLIRQGVAAKKIPGKEGNVSVSVPQDDVARALATMQAHGLPRAPYARMGDVFKKEGLISSPLEERARLVFALSQELAGSISKIDGVIFAQVHVVLPERGGFGETGNPSSAAVFIKHQDTVSLDAVLPQIRRLVANSIPGLAFENVSVVLVPSAAMADVPSSTTPATAAQLESVWGVEVASASANTLRALIVVLASAFLLALAGAGYLFWRERDSRRRTAAEDNA